MKKFQFKKGITADNFKIKETKQNEKDEDTNRYFNITDKYLDESEYDMLASQPDINNFEVDEDSSGEYTKISYPSGSIQIPSMCLEEVKVSIDYTKLHYLIEDFSTYYDMQTFINNRINDGFEIKFTDTQNKIVEMVKSSKLVKTTVK